MNGLTMNGLTMNGLTMNGLTMNGLTMNGLTMNGLGTSDFSNWLVQNAEVNSMLMKYVVRCSLPTGSSLSYQEQSSGTSYTWEGEFGLAPDWANGQHISEPEQQLVSACLAAHVNKYGLHVPLSVLGRTAQQEPIPYTSEEVQTFSRREACFFGNLFTGEGIFAGGDGAALTEGESSPRACGFTSSEGVLVSECAPISHVESCDTLCTLDPSGLFYTQCTYNGRTYLPLTTRVRTQDVYTCGDGVCQFTESCGTGTQANSCLSDCGPCE
ncbi:MAG: hypothetical protein ACJ8AT_03305 [Hyalangium sp.]